MMRLRGEYPARTLAKFATRYEGAGWESERTAWRLYFDKRNADRSVRQAPSRTVSGDVRDAGLRLSRRAADRPRHLPQRRRARDRKCRGARGRQGGQGRRRRGAIVARGRHRAGARDRRADLQGLEDRRRHCRDVDAGQPLHAVGGRSRLLARRHGDAARTLTSRHRHPEEGGTCPKSRRARRPRARDLRRAGAAPGAHGHGVAPRSAARSRHRHARSSYFRCVAGRRRESSRRGDADERPRPLLRDGGVGSGRHASTWWRSRPAASAIRADRACCRRAASTTREQFAAYVGERAAAIQQPARLDILSKSAAPQSAPPDTLAVGAARHADAANAKTDLRRGDRADASGRRSHRSGVRAARSRATAIGTAEKYNGIGFFTEGDNKTGRWKQQDGLFLDRQLLGRRALAALRR